MSTDTQTPITDMNSTKEVQGKWGMVIDQDLCTGCQACVAACSMEYNVPFVGEVAVGYGRSLHRIRISPFWQCRFPAVKIVRSGTARLCRLVRRPARPMRSSLVGSMIPRPRLARPPRRSAAVICWKSLERSRMLRTWQEGLDERDRETPRAFAGGRKG